MKIKTFYAKTMAEAFKEIKTHLGADAILLSTKEIPHRSGVWGHSSGFEVVAACDDTGTVDVFPENDGYWDCTKKTVHPDTENGESLQGIVHTGTYSPAKLISKSPVLSSTRRCFEKVLANEETANLDETENDKGLLFKGKVAARLYHNLVDNGVDVSLAKHLLSKAWNELKPGQRRSRSALIQSVTRSALSMLPATPDQDGMPKKKVVAFVGPTGVGKTTSIAKLAAHLALKNKKKVLLVTTDGYRIGAIDQLRTYAGLMGVPFRFIDQVPDLALTIEENKQRDYILIDTAGRSPKDLGVMKPMADFLKNSGEIERHLVLSVNANSRDLRTIVNNFEICGPDHLLFTKLDETTSPGPILNEIIRTQKSFSYYSDGQRVPEDLHTVTGECIMDLVLNQNDVAFKE